MAYASCWVHPLPLRINNKLFDPGYPPFDSKSHLERYTRGLGLYNSVDTMPHMTFSRCL